jgi:hypothetical protein
LFGHVTRSKLDDASRRLHREWHWRHRGHRRDSESHGWRCGHRRISRERRLQAFGGQFSNGWLEQYRW